MKSLVLDSSAVLAFLFKEEGHEKVVALFEKAAETDRHLLIASPNWAEVRYMVERKMGAGMWLDVRRKLLSLSLAVEPSDQVMAELAGEIKVSRKMSLADCFATALAKQKKAELVTGDKDFRQVESELRGVIWL